MDSITKDILKGWIFGVATATEAYGLQSAIFSEAETRAVEFFLNNRGITLPKVDTWLEACLEYNRTLSEEDKFLKTDDFTFREKDELLEVDVGKHCPYAEPCSMMLKEGTQVACGRAVAFSIAIRMMCSSETGNTVSYHLKSVNPGKKCEIVLRKATELTIATREGEMVSWAIIELADLGPEPLVSTELPFISEDAFEDKESFLFRMGIFYLTSLGLRTDLQTGLFGPLPVSDTPDYLCFIHSFVMEDPNLQDPRFRDKKTIAIACLFFKREDEHFFPRRTILEEKLQKWLPEPQKVKNMNSDFISSLDKKLENFLAKLTVKTKKNP